MSGAETERAPRAVTAGILVVSVAVLMAQVLLTRIFSFTIWYHLAYLTLSTALLGFGAAGAILAAFPSILERDVRSRLGACAGAAGIALLVAMAVLGPNPLEPDRLLETPVSFFFGLLGYYLAVVVPFLLAGMAVAGPLTRWAAQVDRLYAADLLGAGLGCLAAVGALYWLDGPAALFVCAAFFCLGGALYAGVGRQGKVLFGLTVALFIAAPWGGSRAGLPAYGQQAACRGARTSGRPRIAFAMESGESGRSVWGPRCARWHVGRLWSQSGVQGPHSSRAGYSIRRPQWQQRLPGQDA